MENLQRTGSPRRGTVQFRMPRRPSLETSAAPLPAAGGRKKKKMAVARLGGSGTRRSIFGVVGRLLVRCVAAAYRRALRLLRAFYDRALQDLLEGAAGVSTLSAQAGAGCSFGIAVGSRY